MAITFQGLNKDSLGGPAGSTSNSLMQMLQIFAGQQKKQEQQKQLSLLGEIFKQQQPQQPTRGAGGQIEFPQGVPNVPQNTAQQMIERLLSGGITDPDVLNTGFNAISAMPQPKTPVRVTMTDPNTGQAVSVAEGSQQAIQLAQRGFKLGTFPASKFKPQTATFTNEATGRVLKNIDPNSSTAKQLEAQGFVRGTLPDDIATDQEPKTFSKKLDDGSIRTIKNVEPGSEQEAQLTKQGFVQGTQTVGIKPSAAERETERLRGAIDNLSQQATEDPNTFHEVHNFRQNEDGSLFLDPITNAPVRMDPFTKATGKRTNIKAIIGLGEQWDDANELNELLADPEVQANLKKANDEGIWDQVAGKWGNTINKWLQDQGLSGDNPTATAVARIQRMTSDERKKFMGTAVTDSEMKSALAWMPSSGDSFETIVNKTSLMGQEAEQEFRRWLSTFEDIADMSPFYKAFGIKRFADKTGEAEPPAQPTVAPQREVQPNGLSLEASEFLKGL